MDWWNKSRQVAVAMTAFALLPTGCAEPEAASFPIVEEGVPVTIASNTAKAQESVKPAGEGVSADKGSGKAQEATYTPPFPDRVDLFGAPKRQGRGKDNSGAYDEAVQLIGFADLDRPQALLLFNGQISTLSEGESIYGVEVVSIQRPKVVLQRGRQRWQTSLEN